MTLHDKFGRQITDLRISITDRCNFRCVYCRSADPENYRDHDEILSWPELDRLARIFLSLGIRKKRITRTKSFSTVMHSIDVAQKSRLAPTKVNAVLVRGINDDEIEAFASYARETGVIMRFIEFMPLDADR